jgi:hypothetical protein
MHLTGLYHFTSVGARFTALPNQTRLLEFFERMRTNTTTLIKIESGIANNEIISSGGLPIADRAGVTETRLKNDAEITKIAHAKSSKDRHAQADTSFGTLLPWARY